jgi:hypothetical protein
MDKGKDMSKRCRSCSLGSNAMFTTDWESLHVEKQPIKMGTGGWFSIVVPTLISLIRGTLDIKHRSSGGKSGRKDMLGFSKSL